MRASLFIVCVLVSTLFAAPERPTAEEIEKAVAASRERSAMLATASDIPPVTLSELEAQLKDRREQKIQAMKNSTPEKRQKSLALKKEIESFEKQIKELKKSPPPPKAAPKPISSYGLAPLDWSRLSVGSVGRLAPKLVGNFQTGDVKSIQRIEAGKFIGVYQTSTPGASNLEMPTTHNVATLLFIGIEQDVEGRTIQDGGIYELNFDAVVTGEYRYRTATGASKTVFVVENFDPNKPFK